MPLATIAQHVLNFLTVICLEVLILFNSDRSNSVKVNDKMLMTILLNVLHLKV